MNEKTAMTDEKIIDLYWDRNEEAIPRTDEKYGSYCYKIAYNVLKNLEDSEECVNDTWMKTWVSIPPIRPNILRAFLAKITRNLSLDYYRTEHAKKRGGGELKVALEELSECVSGMEDVEKIVDKNQLEEAMNVFVKNLQVNERNIFVRRYFFLESNEEIARRYSLKEANVRKILSRTRAKLKVYLVKEGYDV